MHLNKRTGSIILSVSITASCGPDTPAESTWMLGTFSERPVGYVQGDWGVSQIEILADGAFLLGGVGVDNTPLESQEYAWERGTDESIEVSFPNAGEGGIEAWRITPGERCNEILIQDIQMGEPVGAPFTYVRGAVCVNDLGTCPGPAGSQCEQFKTVWCDDPPPPCEDDTE